MDGPLSRSSSPAMRNRTKKACTSCRLHKTKCNGSQPCVNCVKKGWVCSYERRQRQFSKMLLTPSYMAHIENANEQLSQAVLQLHKMLVDANAWDLGEVDTKENGEPVVHSVIKALGLHEGWGDLHQTGNNEISATPELSREHSDSWGSISSESGHLQESTSTPALTRSHSPEGFDGELQNDDDFFLRSDNQTINPDQNQQSVLVSPVDFAWSTDIFNSQTSSPLLQQSFAINSNTSNNMFDNFAVAPLAASFDNIAVTSSPMSEQATYMESLNQQQQQQSTAFKSNNLSSNSFAASATLDSQAWAWLADVPVSLRQYVLDCAAASNYGIRPGMGGITI